MIMKKKYFYALLLCLTTICHVSANNMIKVENTIIPQGGETILSIECLFDTEFTAYQLELELPEGFTLVLNKDGNPWRENGFPDTDHTISPTVIGEGKYRFVCTSFSKAKLPTTGKLLNVKVRGIADMIVGDVFEGKITNVEFTTFADMISTPLNDINFTLSIGDPADTRTILDENATSIIEAATQVDIRVLRTIKADEWSTICLPFSMTEAQVKTAFGDDVQLGNFCDTQSEYDDADNVVGISIAFEKATEIEANHPYIIKVSQPITEFAVDNVDIDPAEEDALVEVDNGLTGRRRVVYGGMYGTYHAQTELEKFSLFLNSNKFWYSTGLTKMKAFRAYFVMMDVLTDVENAAARISFSFNDRDEETTGIVSRQEQTKGGACYDLQGRKVVKPTKGLYIRNGRKEVER